MVHVFHMPATVTAGYGIFPVDVGSSPLRSGNGCGTQVAGHLDRAEVEVLKVDLEGYPPDSLVAYVENVGASCSSLAPAAEGELPR